MTEKNTESATEDAYVDRGRGHYLIAPRRRKHTMSMGLQPMSAGGMRSAITNLERIANCEVVRVVRPRRKLATLSAGEDAVETYVVRLDEDQAEVFKQSAPPNMIVEADAYLTYGIAGAMPLRATSRVGALSSMKGISPRQIKFKIVGKDNKPVPNVKITLAGDGFPSEGESNKSGLATLPLYTLPGGRARSLFIEPGRDYWTRFITAPPLSDDNVNVIKLQSLEETVAGFPDRFRFGWGQRFMGLDQLPDEFTGKGVKIGIIDSGADNRHPLLTHIKEGVDLTNDENTSTWSDDLVGHGTHCSGVITAQSATGMALRGFAPEAEIHVFKVFPGGQFSSLLDALDYCIELEIDVVNMSLGSPDVSEAVEQKIEEAVENGVACIVAAGNSAGPVQYPAKSPNVLAVAAIGKLGEFPPKTWDSQTVDPRFLSQEGIFSPTFTCFGPEIAVCAPGVSIISSVPDNGFDPESGTSMAAPHVTGLAALILAHHPALKSGPLKKRGVERVAALFQLIKGACTPCNLGPGRTGFGIPMLHGLARAMQSGTAQAGTGDAPQSLHAAAESKPTTETGQAAMLQELLSSPAGQALLAQAMGSLIQQQSQQSMYAAVPGFQTQMPLAGALNPSLLAQLINQARAQQLAGRL